ncbi:phosphinothricin acetyltransferase [Pseudomonas fluorescens]|uniref:Phosphinothricin acetyltransferase n=1 Tax=Pseudomonas fluorescens TaxID=294 RepID=A0A379IMA6_PSEFL|nr:phosphinothricin acetyltransferase [Pseudomonas fluorescens]
MAVKGLKIRTAVITDAEAIQRIYAPIVLNTAISFEETPPSVEEIAQRIATTLQTYPYLVAEDDGEIKGYAYASQHRARPAYRWAVDVTVYVAESARRQGVGRELYETLLPILDKQRFRAAYAGIAQPNEGSVVSNSVEKFPGNSVQKFPVAQAFFTAFFRCLKRKESLPVSRISQW